MVLHFKKWLIECNAILWDVALDTRSTVPPSEAQRRKALSSFELSETADRTMQHHVHENVNLKTFWCTIRQKWNHNWCSSDDSLITLCLSTMTYQLMWKWWQFDYLVPVNNDISTDVEVMAVWLPCVCQQWHINWCGSDDTLITLCLSTLTYQLMWKWWQFTLCLSTQTYQLKLKWWQFDYLASLTTDVSTRSVPGPWHSNIELISDMSQ